MARRGRNRRRGRPVDGVLLLDKPLGLSSNEALQEVKGMLFAEKAGHTGSLDPLASGMLPLCFGEGTKFSRFLLDADKAYRFTMKLGQRTETGDAEGEVIETRPVDVNEAQLQQVVAEFRGPQDQVPSMYSAIKHEGQPLYKLARQGIEVERQPRPINVYSLEILELNGDEATLETRVSKGTYIRSLAEDMGEKLGCGAHVIMLRRLSVGGLDDATMVTMDQLKELREQELGRDKVEALLQPISTMVNHWPTLTLPDASAYYLRMGQPVVVPKAPTEGWVSLQLQDERFLGVGEVLDDGRVAPRRLLTEA